MINIKRKIRYRLPIKIFDASINVIDKEKLLIDKDLYISSRETEITTIKPSGYIILDFGEQIRGGIRLLVTQSKSIDDEYQIRIRFGLTTREINLKDFNIYIPAMSDLIYGDTRFRYVRIDNLSDLDLNIKTIYAREYYRDIKVSKELK